MSYGWGCTECYKGSSGMSREYHYCPYCGYRLIDKDEKQDAVQEKQEQ